jgi:hypothetical protein
MSPRSTDNAVSIYGTAKRCESNSLIKKYETVSIHFGSYLMCNTAFPNHVTRRSHQSTVMLNYFVLSFFNQFQKSLLIQPFRLLILNSQLNRLPPGSANFLDVSVRKKELRIISILLHYSLHGDYRAKMDLRNLKDCSDKNYA